MKKQQILLLGIIALISTGCITVKVDTKGSTEETSTTAAATTTANSAVQSQQQTAAAQTVVQVVQAVIQPFADGVYILPYTDSMYYSKSDFAGWDKQTIRYALNEIYARHGRRFKSSDLQDYFSAQPWYSGTVSSDDFNESVLNKYEKKNIELLSSLK